MKLALKRPCVPDSFVAGLFAAIAFIADANAQSVSPIGGYLSPWGTYGTSDAIAMTPDGRTLVIFEEPTYITCGHAGAGFAQQRLSTVSSDGTGHRVVLDTAALWALPGMVDGWTGGSAMRVSGDGRWGWVTAYDDVSTDCFSFVPFTVQDYLVDIEAGTATLFKHDGMDVGGISYTDDGQTMAFAGFDAPSGSWMWFLADPDGGNAVPFLDVSPWTATTGIISGDGSRFLMIGDHGTFPFPSDVYLFEISTGDLTKLSPETLNNISGASFSYDGSRVVYHVAGSPIWAVNGDGSNHRMLYDGTGIVGTGSATITRDGEWVFFTDGVDEKTLRIRWDGTELTEVADDMVWQGSTTMGHLPVNADGSVLAFYGFNSTWPGTGSAVPLSVSMLDGPRLTTFGAGTPGSTLNWDIAGEPGDAWLLAFSLGLLDPPAPVALGSLSLDPSSLFLLAAGTVGGPFNTGSLSIVIPPGLNLPTPLPIHFQAVVTAPGRQGVLTTATTMVLQDGTTAEAPAGSGGPVHGPHRGHDARGGAEAAVWLTPSLMMDDPSVGAQPRSR